MAELQAFRGLRYDPGHVGSLSDVVAPPYDVIDGPLQEALYQRHPANIIRLILNRPEVADFLHSFLLMQNHPETHDGKHNQ